MPTRANRSLETLPVELVYRILDQMDITMIISFMYNVCSRLNQIVYSYQKYAVPLCLDACAPDRCDVFC